jgi:acetolactate synthase-1/2/3 large subunit
MIFAVAGESYLTVTDALYDNAERIRLYSCRQEGGEAFMAEAGTAPVNSTGNSTLRND